MAVNCSDALPNVMTPNGDGINDFFVVDEAIAFPNNQLIIQNRWGNVVFNETGYRNDFAGLGLNDGVYFYTFYPDSNSKDKSVKQGYLTIIR
jgi:gliding motility-associated-like protein